MLMEAQVVRTATSLQKDLITSSLLKSWSLSCSITSRKTHTAGMGIQMEVTLKGRLDSTRYLAMLKWSSTMTKFFIWVVLSVAKRLLKKMDTGDARTVKSCSRIIYQLICSVLWSQTCQVMLWFSSQESWVMLLWTEYLPQISNRWKRTLRTSKSSWKNSSTLALLK